MGCDITACAEIKLRGSDEWIFYKEIDIGRDYELFSKMAGVRGGQEPISSDKGLPKDISKLSNYLINHYAHHSFSWLSSSELVKLNEWMIKFYDDTGYFKELYCFITNINNLDFTDIRLIFGFDS